MYKIINQTFINLSQLTLLKKENNYMFRHQVDEFYFLFQINIENLILQVSIFNFEALFQD